MCRSCIISLHHWSLKFCGKWKMKMQTDITRTLLFIVFLKIYIMWAIFKVFIEFIAILLLFYVLWFGGIFQPWVMWDLIFLTRDQTHTVYIAKWNLKQWTKKEVLKTLFLKYSQAFPFSRDCYVSICFELLSSALSFLPEGLTLVYLIEQV